MIPKLIRDGFEIVPDVLNEAEVEAMRSALNSLGISPGHRKLMERVPEVAALAISPRIRGILERLLGAPAFPVRSIFFDKTPHANWLVPWHQDLSVAVKRRLDLAGYGPWSMKEGMPHVQPPPEILEAMVTFRLHLDDCDESNGALRVIPKSHRFGRLTAAAISEMRSRQDEVVCSLRAGDALLMRPLLLHASAAALAPSHRRVVHLEYATSSLAEGLEWAEVFKASH